MKLRILVPLLATLAVACLVAYNRFDAARNERQRIEAKAAVEYRELAEKYAEVSEKYNKLRAAKVVVRQVQVVREDKIVNENRDFYSGECLDAAGLQHVQQAQSARSE